MRFSNRREARYSRLAFLRAQPGFGGLMHGIEGGHLNQNVSRRWKLAIHKLEVYQRSQK